MGRGREGGGRYRHDIQGLRAVAVLIVVVFHTGVGLSGGFVGVDAFLVISGFVIAALLRRELASTGTISLRGFYARRIRRLLPSLSVMLVAVVLAAMLLESPLGRQQSTVRTAIAASFSGANLWLYARGTGYFTPDESSNPLLHTWSLSIEEQFYLLLPALLLVLWRIDRRRSAGTPGFVPAAGLALLGAASFALSCAFAYHLGPAMQVTDPERFGFYLLPTRVWEFVAGIGLAFVIDRCAAWHPAIGAAVTTAGAVAVLGAAILFDDATPFPGYLAAVPVVGTAAMIAGGASGGFTARWLGSRALTWIGDRSYGWYLWHWPVIVFLRLVAPDRPALLVAGAVGALGPAALSYRLIERPIRIAPSLNGGRLTRLAFACALVPALLAGGVLAGASVRWGIDTPPEWADQRLATRERCGDEPTVAWNEDCRFSVDDPKGVIVLIGDSQADSLSDGFVEAANRLGYDAVVWFESGCPALLGRPATYSDRCPVWQESTVELVHRLRPALVVVANLSTRYVHASDPGGAQWQAIRDAGGLPTTDRNSAVQAWTEGLGALVDEFAELDVPTLLVSVPPEYPRAFDEGTSLLRGTPDPPVITRDSMDRWRDPAVDAEATVVERRPSASVYDPAVTLCTARDCTPADAGGWWYMDNQHLNPRGSRMLVPSLLVAIESALVPIG